MGNECVVAFAAHALRTPLATQRALLELALADPDADVEAWREAGEGVLRACDEQARLLEACLALARRDCWRWQREPAASVTG
jgi:signal transduction histidine kinase